MELCDKVGRSTAPSQKWVLAHFRLLATLQATLSLAMLLLATAMAFAADPVLPAESSWDRMHEKRPLTADETKALMKRLATFVVENHLK